MGNIPVHHDAESIADPGQLSCVTGPLEEFIDSLDIFYHGVLQALRDPRNCEQQPAQLLTWATKRMQVTEHDDEESFTVDITYDLEKLATVFPLGLPTSLPVSEHITRAVVKASYSNLSITMSKFASMPEEEQQKRTEAGQVLIKDDQGLVHLSDSHLRFHTDPIRIELWLVIDGQRKSGWRLSALLWGWVVLGSMEQKAQVKCYYDVTSEASEGKITISDPLDEWFTYEEFWEQLVDAIKDKGPKQVFRTAKFLQVTDLNETETEVVVVFDDSSGGGSSSAVTMRLHMKFEMTSGDITIVTTVNDTLITTDFYKVHKDPVRVESYTVLNDGTRTASRQDSARLLILLNGIVSNRVNLVMF